MTVKLLIMWNMGTCTSNLVFGMVVRQQEFVAWVDVPFVQLVSLLAQLGRLTGEKHSGGFELLGDV